MCYKSKEISCIIANEVQVVSGITLSLEDLKEIRSSKIKSKRGRPKKRKKGEFSFSDLGKVTN